MTSSESTKTPTLHLFGGDVIAWVTEDPDPQVCLQRAKAINADALRVSVHTHLPAYPANRPVTRGLDFYRWALYASQHPEYHLELEEVYGSIPLHVRVLILKHADNAAMNSMFSRVVVQENLERIAREKLERSGMGPWPHGDISALLGGDEAEAARVASLPYDVRLEAFTALSFSFMINPGARATADRVFPEGKELPDNFRLILSGEKDPVPADGWIRAIKVRKGQVESFLNLFADPQASIVEWANAGHAPHQRYLRAIYLPRAMREAWLEANLASFPKARPSTISTLVFYHWALGAFFSPEGRAELKTAFRLLPKPVHALMSRFDQAAYTALSAKAVK